MQAYKKEQSEDKRPVSKKQKCYFVMWYRFCTLARGEYGSRAYPDLGPPLSRALTAKALAAVLFVLIITIVGITLPLAVVMDNIDVWVDLRLVRMFAQGFIHACMMDCCQRSSDAFSQKECLLNVQW